MPGMLTQKSLIRSAVLSLALTTVLFLSGLYYGSYAALQDTQWRSMHRGTPVAMRCVPCQSSQRLSGIFIRVAVVGLLATIVLAGLAARRSRSRTTRDG
jgi:hypothetical protein